MLVTNKKLNKYGGYDAVCSKIYVHQYKEGGSETRTFHLPCNQWGCEICKKVKIRDLRKRLMQGVSEHLDKIKVNGFRDFYSMKFLTLTWPGAERRSSKFSHTYNPEYTGSESPEDAYRSMRKFWNTMSSSLRKKYGDYSFISTVEPQQDGYPHIHILLMGGGVGNRKLLADLRSLWVDKYGMGTRLNLQVVKKGYRAGISYLLKYLTKGRGRLPKGSRLFSCDKKLLKKVVKEKNKDWVTFEVGSVSQDHLDDFHYFPYWNILNRDYGLSCLGVVPGVWGDVVPF